MPGNKSSGILLMPARIAAAAFDMEGTFSCAAPALDRAASEEAAIGCLADLRDLSGRRRAYGRDRQISTSFIVPEIERQHIGAMILPPISYGVPAFVLSMVEGRIIALRRSEAGFPKTVAIRMPGSGCIARCWLVRARLPPTRSAGPRAPPADCRVAGK